jgi:type I restriction enzyme, S subunit
VTKRVYAALVDDAEEYMLHAGWLVMACSGQVYGLNGAVMLLGDRHEGIFGTHDLIRLLPDGEKVRTGYLLLALENRVLGRPVVIRNAYGTSIPHLDVVDVEQIRIPRLADAVEAEISDLMLEAVKLRSVADDLEDSITAEAEDIVARFIRGLELDPA